MKSMGPRWENLTLQLGLKELLLLQPELTRLNQVYLTYPERSLGFHAVEYFVVRRI